MNHQTMNDQTMNDQTMMEHVTNYKPYNEKTMIRNVNEMPPSYEDTVIGIPIQPDNHNSRSAFGTKNQINKSPENTFWKNQKQLHNNPTSAATYPPNNFDGLPTIVKSAKKMSLPEFVHKTLNYVFAQICVTAAVTTIMYMHKTIINNYINQHYGIVWAPIIITFITLMVMFCCNSKETEGLKKSMFCLFTLSCSAMVGVSAMQYAPEIILNATITLFVIVGFVNIYAYNTAKRGKDFTSLGPTLVGFLVMIITLGIINIFVKSSLMQLCIAAVSVIIFTALLLYDLNRLYIGSDYNEYNEQPDPLLSAINIYLDILNIFLNLLQIFGNGSTPSE